MINSRPKRCEPSNYTIYTNNRGIPPPLSLSLSLFLSLLFYDTVQSAGFSIRYDSLKDVPLLEGFVNTIGRIIPCWVVNFLRWNRDLRHCDILCHAMMNFCNFYQQFVPQLVLLRQSSKNLTSFLRLIE